MADVTPSPVPRNHVTLSSAQRTELDEARAAKLILVAHGQFRPELWEAELEVLRVSASFVDPFVPNPDAPRPLVRAEFVRWLATDKVAAPFVASKGLRAFGVTIPGGLDLYGCRPDFPLMFWQCTIAGDINLQYAETRDFFVIDCTVDGITRAVQPDGTKGADLIVGGICADRIIVNGSLDLTGSSFCRGISLLGAQITGYLSCTNAHLLAETRNDASQDAKKVVGADPEKALEAGYARIKSGAFFSDGFKSSGDISVASAEIGNDLRFDGAEVRRVFCNNLQLSGDLVWTSIVKAKEPYPKDADKSTDADGLGSPYLDLSGATIKNLRDDLDSWPVEGNLFLNGFVYNELFPPHKLSREDVAKGVRAEDLPQDVADRIRWLMRQPPERRNEPQPWMQLSTHLVSKGDQRGAKYVLFNLKRVQAAGLKWDPWQGIHGAVSDFRRIVALLLQPREAWPYFRNPNRSLAIAFAWLEEAPARILYSIALTLLIGTLIFAGAGRSSAMIQTDAKTDADHYPPFQPFVYTFDNAVPLVKLGMDEKWRPDPHHTALPWFPAYPWLNWLAFFNSYWFLAVSRWMLMISGWVQAGVLAAALSGIFKQ